MGGSIIGWGASLPELVVTNKDFEKRLDTSDTWIVERTGIRERRMGGPTSALAIVAGQRSIERAGLTGDEIDLLIIATSTPDRAIPATSSLVHAKLGLSGGAFDLNAACAGFVYALVTADGLLRMGHRCALVIGADTLSSVTDQEDRSTAVLFGDAAAALIIRANDKTENFIVSYDLGVDGAFTDLLYQNHGGFIQMEGREVFRRAVRAEVDSITAVLERADLKPADIALFVPHQANLRIIEAVNARIGFDLGQTAIVLDRTGNTSAASIPLALCDATEAGRLHDGDYVLMSGFGAGMTWASTIVRWGECR
ncbi:MAG TPA: beta-ketoacyl-ACP synthase III [Acidimicrobiales bacterium]|nr:beta-ketoacyl-ACP synthase III [Acidimicrobiales bacterium]